jgi:hypothetical protein
VPTALRGDAGVADQLIVAHRAGEQVEQEGADEPLFAPEDLLARLAHGAHLELERDDHEGRGLTGEGVAGAGEHHAHAAAVAHTPRARRAPRRFLRGVAAT